MAAFIPAAAAVPAGASRGRHALTRRPLAAPAAAVAAGGGWAVGAPVRLRRRGDLGAPAATSAARRAPLTASAGAASAADAGAVAATANGETPAPAVAAPSAVAAAAGSVAPNPAAEHMPSHPTIHVAPGSDPSLMDSVHVRVDSSRHGPLALVVVGASGDLAKKKTFPAIFSLFYHDLLPDDFVVYGFARRDMSDEAFREMILGTLTCRVIDGARCAERMEAFLPRCFYHKGTYDDPETFATLDAAIVDNFESKLPADADPPNRLFYLAVPPSVFAPSAEGVNTAARAKGSGWTRVVVEKPFGRDSASYGVLRSALGAVLSEDEIYRIDHYCGKELVQNLMTLRFANAVFEPIWNRHHIESVQIVFKEPFGVEGRAGYFDNIGIVRDIMQNHLLQVFALLAMEPPVSLHAEDIRNEKVKLLRSVLPLAATDFALGQYEATADGKPGYTDDEGVPAGSRTPTFASCVLKVNNARWAGVPILIKAGKALDERVAEVRVQFKPVAGDIFGGRPARALANNELVIRVQPDEAIYMRIVSKVPGLTSRMEEARLNLFYRHAWEESKDIPDAYERLILDVIQGEKSLFIRDDEVEIAWDLFTPALEAMEAPDATVVPDGYAYGSVGPANSDQLAESHGVRWSS